MVPKLFIGFAVNCVQHQLVASRHRIPIGFRRQQRLALRKAVFQADNRGVFRLIIDKAGD